MEEVQKDERKENRGDRSFIRRDVYTHYCGYWKDIRIADIIQKGMIYAVLRISRVRRNRGCMAMVVII